jgi:phosphoglycolate phosphatase
MDKALHVVFDCDGTLVDTSGQVYQLFPGIKELLSDLAQDCCLYVWTARGRSSTLRILQENGIASLFEGVFTADDGPGKPHVAGLVALLPGAPKESCWVIGDSSNDMLGARAFGAHTIGACWNQEVPPQFLQEAGAEFVVKDPFLCSKLIRQI